MDTYQATVGDGSVVQGKGFLEFKGSVLKAPESIIMTVEAARSYYNNFRTTHVDRIRMYAAIEGLIAGNPPYNPQKLAALGLSHISNVNTLDGKGLIERASLTFFNLHNQSANLVAFTVHPFQTDQDQDFSTWGEVLSRNWTKVIREKWPGFVKQMNMLTGQLVKFGYSPLVWSDEEDFRWKTVDVSRFYCADQTSVDPDEWDCICVETPYTIQYLYTIYLEMVKKRDAGVPTEDIPWDIEALENFLVKRANTSQKGTGNQDFSNMLDIQKAMQNKSWNFANAFTDTVRLVSLFYKEYSTKISHFIFDPIGDGDGRFLFKLIEQYNEFQEGLVVFTYSPGEQYIHGNRGVGHKIFPVCQAMMHLDNHMLDMCKMSATPIIKSNTTAGKNLDPIRFISGVATDIGGSEFVQNQLGANIGQLVQVAGHMENKVNKNAIIGGDDPSRPDMDTGSKSAPEIQMQSLKEFGVGKQSVAHFYETDNVVVRQMTIKMLRCKEGHPAYKIVKEWKRRCVLEGVPEEIFDIPKDTEPGQMPAHLSVRAAQVAGDGSHLGLIVGLNGVQGIAGGFGAKGQYNYRKDIILSRLGIDYVDRYLSDSGVPDEAGSGATVAHLENLIMRTGEMPQATKDNNHKTHMGSHIAFIMDLIQKVQAQKVDPVAADRQLAVSVPHCEEHVEFISQDSLNRAYVEGLIPQWRQIKKFAQLNRVTAQNMMKAEARRREQEQQQLNADMMEQDRKDKVAVREQGRKDFESEQKMERAKEQSQLKGEIMRTGVKMKGENQQKEIELKAENERHKNAQVVGKPQDILADKTTEQLQSTLSSQVGRTANPADFE